jgi:hypothetical protein
MRTLKVSGSRETAGWSSIFIAKNVVFFRIKSRFGIGSRS